MAYFMNLNEMYEDINRVGYGRSCDDIMTPKALTFLMRWTMPPPGVVPRTPDKYGEPKPGGIVGSPLEGIDSSIKKSELKLLSQIKKTSDLVTEKNKITAQNKNRIAIAQRGKTYDINEYL